MPWLASLITDYQLHRRRFVIACIAIAVGLILLATSVPDASGTWKLHDVSGAVMGFVTTLHFARMAWQEWARMKETPR